MASNPNKILLAMPVFLSTNYKEDTLSSQFVTNYKGFIAMLFKIIIKNIANINQEHDVSAIIKQCPKITLLCFVMRLLL